MGTHIVKTTIDINDDLGKRAKALAAAQRTTLREVIERGIRLALREAKAGDPYKLTDKSVQGCVSAVISCLTNIGPAFFEFGPTKTYASLSTSGTLLLPLLMILGRLEYVAILVLFSRTLWRRY